MNIKSSIVEFFIFSILSLLFMSAAFYYSTPIHSSIPGLTTFTLTKLTAYIYIFASVLYIFFLRYKPANYPPELFILALFVITGITVSLFTDNKIENLKSASNPFLGLIMLFLILSHKKVSPLLFAKLPVLILISGIISVLGAYLELFSGNAFDNFFGIFRHENLHWDFNGNLRLSGLFCDTNYLSNFLIFFIPFVFGFYMLNSSGLKYLIFTVIFAASFQVLILTYSRSNTTALIGAFILAALILFLFKNKQQKFKKTILTALSIIFILYLINFKSSPVLTSRLSSIQSDYITSERVYLHKTALKMIKLSNYMGIGYAEYGQKIHNDQEYIFPGINSETSRHITSPHSLYLGITQASGIIGLLFFLIFSAAFAVRNALQILSANNRAAAVFIWFTAYMASGFLGKEMYVIEETMYFFLFLSVGYIFMNQAKTDV